MRVTIFLENTTAAFSASAEQVARIAEQLPGHHITRAQSEAELLEQLATTEVAVVWRFEREWYARAPRLTLVATPSAGRELVAADPSGRVTRQFGTFHGPIMAESLLAMMLFMKRRLGIAMAAQGERRWDRTPFETTRGLAGDTALIVGFGAIGRHCARLLRACGVTVHGLRRRAAKSDPSADRLFHGGELAVALEQADHVVCVLPSDTGTDHLIDSAALERMKRTAYLYNLGRGNAIDPEALCQALRDGRLAGAFLDVTSVEPLPQDSPLWTTPNLYLTPHASAVRADYLDRYFDELVAVLARQSH